MYIFEANKTHHACYFCLMPAKQNINLSQPYRDAIFILRIAITRMQGFRIFQIYQKTLFLFSQLRSNECSDRMFAISKKGGGGGKLATMKTIFYSLKLSNSNCPQNKLIKSESILFSSQQHKILVKAQCCFTPLLFFHVICCENVASLNKLDKGLEMSCLVKIGI